MKNKKLVTLGKRETLSRYEKHQKNHLKMMCQHALYSIGKFSYFREHR